MSSLKRSSRSAPERESPPGTSPAEDIPEDFWCPGTDAAGFGHTQEVLAVVRGPEAPKRQARLLRWGVIPSWARDPSIGSRLINAQAETMATKPAFRRAFRERRCLVFVDGLYEWRREDRRKQPFHIRLHDGRPFASAGPWQCWAPQEGQPIDSCTILTLVTNDLIRPLQVRMPEILSPAGCDAWLDPSIREVEHLQPVLRPYPPEELTTYPMSRRVNDPANDAPECIEPLPRQRLTTN
jgi:putative SOS response-associated peptidase YedK